MVCVLQVSREKAIEADPRGFAGGLNDYESINARLNFWYRMKSSKIYSFS